MNQSLWTSTLAHNYGENVWLLKVTKGSGKRTEIDGDTSLWGK